MEPITMLKRICVAAAITAAALLMGTPAHASGPTPQFPSTTPLTRHQAHQAALGGTRVYLAAVLPGSKFHVGRCTHGPMIWHCPMRLRSEDTRCTAVVWVWADGGNHWFEYHRMRCTPSSHRGLGS